MKIGINLLPPERKKILSTKYLFKIILDQEVKIGAVCLMTILALWGVQAIVAQQHASLIKINAHARENEAYAEVRDLHTLFRETNATTKKLHMIYSEHMEWTGILTLIGKSRPENVVITEIKTDDALISIAGIAGTPPDLVLFAEGLRNARKGDETCFHDIDVPDEFLAGGQASEFRMTLFVDSQNCLRSQ